MKPTAVLVNTSRGPVVDHAALAEALRDGTIFAAALDVTDPEPIPPDDPLLALDNCLVVPAHRLGVARDPRQDGRDGRREPPRRRPRRAAPDARSIPRSTTGPRAMADFALRPMEPSDGPAIDVLMQSEALTTAMALATHYRHDVYEALIAQYPTLFGVVATSPTADGLVGMATAYLDQVTVNGEVRPSANLANLKVRSRRPAHRAWAVALSRGGSTKHDGNSATTASS